MKDEPAVAGKYDEMLDSLNPVFLSTPALAFGRCYDVLLVMSRMAMNNIRLAFGLFTQYDPKIAAQIDEDETYVDQMADRVSNYLVQISASITSRQHVEIMNYYYSAFTEFERLSDHALNLSEIATELNEKGNTFSQIALSELSVLWELLDKILHYTSDTFQKQNLSFAREIEPLEEVVDDMVNTLKNNHLERLYRGECEVFNSTQFFNLLSEAERISDVCSNVGVATVARATPGINHQVHDYISMLHSGRDEDFNHAYQDAHDQYFDLLQKKEA